MAGWLLASPDSPNDFEVRHHSGRVAPHLTRPLSPPGVLTTDDYIRYTKKWIKSVRRRSYVSAKDFDRLAFYVLAACPVLGVRTRFSGETVRPENVQLDSRARRC